MIWPLTLPRQPLVVHLHGPSGAGKTSLRRALQWGDPRIVAPTSLSKVTLCYHLVKNCMPLLRPFFRDHRNTRWFTRREMLYLASISARYDHFKRYRHDNIVFVIMKGALYELAYLRIFGPPLTHSETFQRWHSKWCSTWSNTVNVVVLLDAPDEVLLRRVNARDQIDMIKGKSIEDASLYFAYQRRCHHAAVVSSRCANFLHIDTSRVSISESAEQVLRAVKAAADGGSLTPQAMGLIPGAEERPELAGS